MNARMWWFEALTNYIVLLSCLIGIPLGFALWMAADNPLGAAIAALALYVGGASCFVIARMSVIRQGIRVSFGSKHMSRGHRRLYRLGYALMIAGLVLHAAIWILAAQPGT